MENVKIKRLSALYPDEAYLRTIAYDESMGAPEGYMYRAKTFSIFGNTGAWEIEIEFEPISGNI